MWIKREWLQLGGKFILEFLKASIADLITLFFSWLQNSEGGGDSGVSFCWPLPIFIISEDQNSTFSLFETFGKKLAEIKIVARVNVKKIEEKNWKKAFKSAAVKRQRFFTKIWFFSGFLAAVEAFLNCFE